METDKGRAREESRGRSDPAVSIATYPVRHKHMLAPIADAQSPAAEQYRTIKARLDYLGRIGGKPLQSIVVTSPSPGDGKTLTSLNLSLILSQDPARDVLLIECDLRRPGIREFFTHSPGAGLVEVLNNEVKLSAALVRPENSRLLILPAGGRTEYPAELLASARMQRLLEILRKRFDNIVLDTPPVVPFVDADEMAGQSDGVVLVLRAGQTPRRAAARAMEIISKHPVIGVVLNDVQPTPIDRYYTQYGYDYYYDYRTDRRTR